MPELLIAKTANRCCWLAVDPKVEAPDTAAELPMSEDFATKFNSLNDALSNLTARIEGIEKSIASQSFAKVEDLNAVKDVVAKTYTVVEGLVNTPSASVENKFSSNKRTDKINELRNLLNN